MTIELDSGFIHFTNISLKYHNEFLFDNLSISFPLGKCSCILGPSGVGKSSLLKYMLSTLRNISYLSQENSLLPWLTSLENAVLQIRLKKFSKQDKKILISNAKDLLAKIGLKEALNLYPHELSGGMRQRVALARTFLENKEIILLDEPFSSLDAITRFNLQTLTAKLISPTKTIILVTHDPLEALRLADEIFILGGKPAKVIQKISLQTPTPRELTDENVIKWQAKLLHELTNAHEAML